MGAPTVQKSALAPTTSTTAAATPGASIPYTFLGSIALSTSPSITPQLTTTVTGLSGTLSTAGTTETTVELLKNGAVVATLVIPANATYAHITLNPNVVFNSRQDQYSLSITVAGTGAVNLGGEIETLVTS